MKATIEFKYVSHEQKTSSKGNIYNNICILQGVDLQKVYYPYEKLPCTINSLQNCKGEIEIKTNKYGTNIVLNDFKVCD